MIDPIFYEFLTINELSTGVSKLILDEIEYNSGKFKHIDLFLSGGSTPVYLYKILATEIECNQVRLMQVDERWVSINSDRSNQKMIEGIFGNKFDFIKIGTPDNFSTPEKAVEEYEMILHQSKKENVYRIGIYGMGEDGHTASLFPNVFKSYEVENRFAHAYFVPAQNEERISITPKLMNIIDRNVLLITGEKKGLTLAEAYMSKDFEKYPVLNLFQNQTDIYLDKKSMKSYHDKMNL